MNKAKVKTCEVIVPWKIWEHIKAVVLYIEYASIVSKANYTLVFCGDQSQFFEKAAMLWVVVKDKIDI